MAARSRLTKESNQSQWRLLRQQGWYTLREASTACVSLRISCGQPKASFSFRTTCEVHCYRRPAVSPLSNFGPGVSLQDEAPWLNDWPRLKARKGGSSQRAACSAEHRSKYLRRPMDFRTTGHWQILQAKAMQRLFRFRGRRLFIQQTMLTMIDLPLPFSATTSSFGRLKARTAKQSILNQDFILLCSGENHWTGGCEDHGQHIKATKDDHADYQNAPSKLAECWRGISFWLRYLLSSVHGRTTTYKV